MSQRKNTIQSSSNFLVTQSNQLVEANYSSNLTALAHKVAKLIMGFINPEEDKKNISINSRIAIQRN